MSVLRSYRVPQGQIIGVDDRNNWNELQCNLCSVVIVSRLLQLEYRGFELTNLKSVVRRLGQGIQPMADRIMTLILTLIKSEKTSTVLEDAFLVVGSLASGKDHLFLIIME